MKSTSESLPWIVYCRVSTEEQAMQGVSLDAQRAACLASAKSFGYQVVDVVDDPGFSGKDFDRPGIRRVIALVEKRQIAGIIIWRLDRLIRNTKQLLEFVELIVAADVKLISLSEKIDTSGAIGILFLTLLGALAQFERQQISERVKASYAYLKANGRFIGGPPPTGLTVTNIDGKKYLAPHPTHGPIVAEAFRQVIEGAALSRIAGLFTEHALPNRSGKPWSINAVSYCLKQKRLVGHLIDQETYDRCQTALSVRVNPQSRRSRRVVAHPAQHPSDRIWRLHGLTYCAKCGSALVGGSGTSVTGIIYPYLRCSGRMRRGKSFCTAGDLPAETWENVVIQRVTAYVSADAFANELGKMMAKRQANTATARAQRDVLVRERDGVRQRLDRALELCLEGGATARAYSGKIADMQERLERLDLEIATLEGQIAAADMNESTLKLTVDLIRLGIQRLPDLPFDLQKQYLLHIIKRCNLTSDGPCTIDIRLPEPLQVQLSLSKPGRVRTGTEEWLATLDHVRTADVVRIPLNVDQVRRARGRIEVNLKPEPSD